ncbi:MAG: MATE family efflux transporter [Desulfobulbaceae bacterium]|nr:MATE family efflux transporter [Desulfobulbaceae bacterium]
MNRKNLFRHEALLLLKLTGPILLGQLSQTSMGFVDTVMAGRVGPVDLAAVAVGSSLFFPIFLFMVGLLSAVTPLTAQAHGRRDSKDVFHSLQKGIVVGFFCGIVTMVIMWNISPIFQILQVSPEVASPARKYIFAVSWGLPFAGIFLALRSGGEGVSLTRLSMLASFTGLSVNIVANYVLIFGKLGLPAMGGVGCGWATAISMFAMMLTMALLLQRSRVDGVVNLFSRLDGTLFRSMGQFLVLGMPVGLSLFVECSIFAIISLLIARFGPEIVSAHQIALNFTSLLFMIPLSLSMALSIRVGYSIGEKQPVRMKIIVQTGLFLAFCFACGTCLFIVICANPIALLYTKDIIVRERAVHLLLFAALFQLSDAIQVNCCGALRGCKDTAVPMFLMIFAYWGIGLPVGYGIGIIGLGSIQPGPEGFWIGLICGLSISAILQGRRLYKMVGRLQDARPLSV